MAGNQALNSGRHPAFPVEQTIRSSLGGGGGGHDECCTHHFANALIFHVKADARILPVEPLCFHPVSFTRASFTGNTVVLKPFSSLFHRESLMHKNDCEIKKTWHFNLKYSFISV